MIFQLAGWVLCALRCCCMWWCCARSSLAWHQIPELPGCCRAAVEGGHLGPAASWWNSGLVRCWHQLHVQIAADDSWRCVEQRRGKCQPEMADCSSVRRRWCQSRRGIPAAADSRTLSGLDLQIALRMGAEQTGLACRMLGVYFHVVIPGWSCGTQPTWYFPIYSWAAVYCRASCHQAPRCCLFACWWYCASSPDHRFHSRRGFRSSQRSEEANWTRSPHALALSYLCVSATPSLASYWTNSMELQMLGYWLLFQLGSRLVIGEFMLLLVVLQRLGSSILRPPCQEYQDRTRRANLRAISCASYCRRYQKTSETARKEESILEDHKAYWRTHCASKHYVSSLESSG